MNKLAVIPELTISEPDAVKVHKPARPLDRKHPDTELFELNAAARAAEQGTKRERNEGVEIKSGSVIVRISGRDPGPWFVCWRNGAGAKRERVCRSKYSKAVSFAKAKAADLSRGDQAMMDFGPADRASYKRALELIEPTGRSLEVAAAEYAAAIKRLGVSTLDEAVKLLLEHRPADIINKKIPDVVAELIARKVSNGKGAKWIRNLKQRLERFAESFTGPLHSLQAHDLDKWLCELKDEKSGKLIGLRTRKNYRDGIVALTRYGQDQNYLAKNWDVLKHVEDPEVPLTEIRVYTPAQMRRYLACAGKNLIPLMVLVSFVGVRHEEMSSYEKAALVDWRNINLDKGTVKVDKRVAKIKKTRIIKLCPNAIAWLRPYAKRSGPICELKHSGDALSALGEKAGIPWVKNAMRKSFISYRLAQCNDIGLVAREAGNSADEIEDTYLDAMTEEEAKEWFDIYPPAPADLIQMSFI